MWNKDKKEYETGGQQREAESRPERAERPERPEPVRPPAASTGASTGTGPSTGGPAMIGRSISIRGEVTGDEDMVIQGRVEGSVDLKQHSVTVGPEGEVKANVIARVVTVQGKVVGNLSGEEQVILRASARVEGDIVAPRVVLEDGTVFRGSVEMGEVASRSHRAANVAARPEKAETVQKPAEAEKRPSTPAPEHAKAKTPAASVAEVKG
jgi:cytoskeletal protein CcmA (bactofilin family)